MASNETHFRVASKLYASIQNPAAMRRIFEGMDYFEHELLVDEIFGALSFLLRGRLPADIEPRVSRLMAAQPLLEILLKGVEDHWSLIGQTAFLEVGLHAWVLSELTRRSHTIASDSSVPATSRTLILLMFRTFGDQIDASVDPLLIEALQADGDLIEEPHLRTLHNLRGEFESSLKFGPSFWVAGQDAIAKRGMIALSAFVLGWMGSTSAG
ncbi:MAG: hypothetical protein R3E66_01135 [bacterium]